MGAIKENVPSFRGNAHNLVDGGGCRDDSGATDNSGAGIPVHERAARRNGHDIGAPQIERPLAKGKRHWRSGGAPTKVAAPNADAPARNKFGGDVTGWVGEADGDSTARSYRCGHGSQANIECEGIGGDDANREGGRRRRDRVDDDVAANGSGSRYDLDEAARREAMIGDGNDDLRRARFSRQQIAGGEGGRNGRDVIESREFAREQAYIGSDDGGRLPAPAANRSQVAGHAKDFAILGRVDDALPAAHKFGPLKTEANFVSVRPKAGSVKLGPFLNDSNLKGKLSEFLVLKSDRHQSVSVIRTP